MPRILHHYLLFPVLALLLTMPANAFAENPAVSPVGQMVRATLEVTGQASVSVEPDIALIAFTVESNARKAEDAMAENAGKTETLLASLRKIMGDEDKLQTANFSLQPVYEKDDRLRPSGYRVINRVSLETLQIGNIGQFIDQAAASGTGKISSLQFRSSHEADQRAAAAAMAVGQARIHAQKLAQAAGVRIVRIVQMRYAPQGLPGVFYEKAALAASRTPIEIGELAIEAEVNMVFEIE